MASTSITVRDYHTEIPGEISDDKAAWLFPQITSVNTHGKKTEWRVHVKAVIDDNVDNPRFVPITDSMFDNAPDLKVFGWIKVESRIAGGKIKQSAPTIVRKGKNLKSSSRTNAFCQALRDAYSLYNKQLKRAYTPDTYPPMLAKVVRKDALTYPVYLQTKFNGVRAVTTFKDHVIMYSRGLNLYPGFEYIKTLLEPILRNNPGLFIDGEIYSHGTPLQEISGAARREGSTARFTYMIYDCFRILPGTTSDPRNYSERLAWLHENAASLNTEYTKVVETYVCADWSEIEELYGKWIAEGYEGAMIRLDQPYKFSYNSHHSKVLLKLKPTQDAEYPIVDWTVGEKGKADGALMIVCAVKSGEKGVEEGEKKGVESEIRFPVTPAMEIEERKKLALKMPVVEENGKTHFENNYKGKPLIVYFAEKSKDNVPQQGRTKMEIRTWD